MRYALRALKSSVFAAHRVRRQLLAHSQPARIAPARDKIESCPGRAKRPPRHSKPPHMARSVIKDC